MSYNARVYRKQGATELVIDSSGLLNIASGSISLPTNLAKGIHVFDLLAARELASAENFLGVSASASGTTVVFGAVGGLLHAGSDPSLAMFSSGAHAHRISWSSANVDGVRLPTFVKPPDFDSSSPVTIHLLAEAGSVSGNAGVDIRVWNDLNTTEAGATCASFTSALAEYSIMVGASHLSAHPGFINITLVPGAHQNDAVDLYAAWAEYTRRTS